MKNLNDKFLSLLFLCWVGHVAQVNAMTYSTISDGDWTNMATWTGGSVPPSTTGTSDIVTINHAVSINTAVINNGTINVNVSSNIAATFSLHNNKTLNIAGTGAGTTLTIDANGELFNNAPDGTINLTGTSMAPSSLTLSMGGIFSNFDAINVGADCNLYLSDITDNSGAILLSGIDAQIVMNADMVNTSTGIIQLENDALFNLDAGVLYNSGALNLLCNLCDFNMIDGTITNENGGKITGSGRFLYAGVPPNPSFLTNETGSKINPGTDANTGFLSFYQYTFGPSTLKCKIDLTDLSKDYIEILDIGTIDNTAGTGSKLAVHVIGTGNVVAPGDIYTFVSTIPGASLSGTFNLANVTVTGGNITAWHLTQTTSEITLEIDAVLPIELISFDAQNTEGGKNLLTWRTASEVNNKHFDIERSTDVNTFHNIGQVKGNNKPSGYEYVDATPFTTSYYRLKQVDFDGTKTYSKVVSVKQKGKSKGLKVYPTLVSNGILTVDTEVGQLLDFSVMNLLGQQVLGGKSTQKIDVSTLSRGTYLLKVGIEAAKFIKQ